MTDARSTKSTKEMRETRDAEWLALNGHTMTGIQYRYVTPYGRTEWRTEGWSATHSENCECSDEGYTGMEDW